MAITLGNQDINGVLKVGNSTVSVGANASVDIENLFYVYDPVINGVARFESGDSTVNVFLSDNSTTDVLQGLVADGNTMGMRGGSKIRFEIPGLVVGEFDGKVFSLGGESPHGNALFCVPVQDSGTGAFSTQTYSTLARTHWRIRNLNGLVGTVGTSGSSTSYNTSSDYRLKESVTPMTGAIDKIQKLKPVEWTWKVDGMSGQGFIAHELQEIFPDAVTGEKDAVDEEGNPQYQGVDTSFLVAALTKAIQEQQQIIENLSARIEALEAQ